MRILVTRPEPDAERTAAKLRGLGHEPVISPLLTLAFAAPPDDLPEPVALVLTSRNAVRAISAWPQAAGWRRRPIFVTGGGTAGAARRAGFTDVRSADGDADDLAAFLMAAIGPETGPIHYPAARDRSERFLAGLRAGGYDIRTIEAYSADMATGLDPAIDAAFRAGRIDGVLFYSGRTAEAFRRLIDGAGLAGCLAATRFYALSERVAVPLRDLAAEIAVADHPDEDGLLALLAKAAD